MSIPDISYIQSVESLQAINGTAQSAALKILNKLDHHATAFIKRSPFLILATTGPDGSDASPRGDDPGFVQVLDDTTLLIPERPGNRLADSMSNIVNQPTVGILMMIPGMNETLRINGQAYITDEADYLSRLAHKGKVPRLAIVVDVQQMYFHCAKAFIRSKLWHPETLMDRSELPTLGKIIMDQISGKETSNEEADALDAVLETDVKENLY